MNKVFLPVIVLICFSTFFVLGGCVSNDLDDYGQVLCNDTSEVSYARNVKPIIEHHCIACHDGKSFEINLKSFDKVRQTALAGKLYGAVIGARTTSMPPTYKLNSCEISQIRDWVEKGALEN